MKNSTRPSSRYWRDRLILIPLAISLFPAAAAGASLVVTIEGVRNASGNVYVALFSKAEEFPDGDHADRYVKVEAKSADIIVTFAELIPGRYALGAYHDENGNGRFDTNFLGFPAEGYALSNGVRAILSRPRFVDASFPLGEEEKPVTLHIGY
ncbi:MAG TPA: DUF2141 domain-containing protein [Stellaceae bacterium]|nr:DUF2141 domain-containing protein [Stellaceae bacterium]